MSPFYPEWLNESSHVNKKIAHWDGIDKPDSIIDRIDLKKTNNPLISNTEMLSKEEAIEKIIEKDKNAPDVDLIKMLEMLNCGKFDIHDDKEPDFENLVFEENSTPPICKEDEFSTLMRYSDYNNKPNQTPIDYDKYWKSNKITPIDYDQYWK